MAVAWESLEAVSTTEYLAGATVVTGTCQMNVLAVKGVLPEMVATEAVPPACTRLMDKEFPAKP
jgi:hypothetical protein